MEFLFSQVHQSWDMTHFIQSHLAEEVMWEPLMSIFVSVQCKHSVHTDTTHIPPACTTSPLESHCLNFAKPTATAPTWEPMLLIIHLTQSDL